MSIYFLSFASVLAVGLWSLVLGRRSYHWSVLFLSLASVLSHVLVFGLFSVSFSTVPFCLDSKRENTKEFDSRSDSFVFLSLFVTSGNRTLLCFLASNCTLSLWLAMPPLCLVRFAMSFCLVLCIRLDFATTCLSFSCTFRSLCLLTTYVLPLRLAFLYTCFVLFCILSSGSTRIVYLSCRVLSSSILCLVLFCFVLVVSRLILSGSGLARTGIRITNGKLRRLRDIVLRRQDKVQNKNRSKPSP